MEENQAYVTEKHYAGFWVRFGALLLDGIVLGTVFAILNSLWNIDIQNPPPEISLLQSLITVIYYVLFTVNYGQTLGKMALGIRVIRQDGGPSSWGAILFRETIGKFFSAITLLIGYIMVGFDPKKRALHDRLAKTYVVKAS